MLDLDELLASNGYDDWSTDGFGPFDSNLICPCGYMIEMDGRCPDGCVSPMRLMGLI